MAPQLTNKELDFIVKNGQSAPTEVHAKLVKMRARKQLDGPHLTSVRRALKGQTHRRGRIETRGRKRKLQPRSVRRLNTVRKELQKKVKGDREVPWEEVTRKARGPKVHPSTAARRLMEAGCDVKWRRPREKPLREREHLEERKFLCDRFRRLPKSHWSSKVDLIMDNKKFQAPTHKRAKLYLRKAKVRGHLRTRSEGLKQNYTKPNPKKHRVNPGCSLSVCAGIINCRVKLWHYLPQGPLERPDRCCHIQRAHTSSIAPVPGCEAAVQGVGGQRSHRLQEQRREEDEGVFVHRAHGVSAHLA